MHCSIQVIWLLVTLQSVGCTIIKKPNATYTIDEGEDLQLECSTDLDKSMIWWFAKHDSSPKIEVAWGLVIGGVVKSRYKINSTTPKDFNLVILNADRDHAGNYTCYDDEGADNVGVSTQLRVGKQHVSILDVNENSTETELTTLFPPHNPTEQSTTEEPASEGKSHVAAIVVVVLIVLLLVIVAIVAVHFWRKRRQRKQPPRGVPEAEQEQVPLKSLTSNQEDTGSPKA